MPYTKKNHLLRNSLFIAIGVGSIISGIFILWLATLQMPDLASFDPSQVAQSTKIYDRTGTVLLYDEHRDVKRTVIPFDQMPENIKSATIAIEDADFYSHGGIKVSSTIRAALSDLLIKFHLISGFTQGGSTITQQVIKNSLLSQERSVTRKVKEWVLAIRLEKMMTKDKILALYLNENPYGGTLYGIEEASQAYYGISAKNIDLAQAAYLAAIPQAPTYYSPYGNHVDKLETRKNLVLKRMLELKIITQDAYNQASTEKVTFLPPQDRTIKAPHFVFYVLSQLEQKYGKDAVQSGGLKVLTTLNFDLQNKAEVIIADYGEKNVKLYNAHNAGMVAIDPKTGQILLMVGSRDYFNTSIDGNFNITTASRQPGSSFKPFVYATAFAKGYRPDTVVWDIPTQFSTACSPQDVSNDTPPCYAPQNYDNKFRGPINLRDAIAESLNIPSVQVLYLAGIADSINTAKRMGVSTLGSPSRYGLSLVLGGGEVTLLDMTSAYGVFANNGVRNPPTAILEVDDNQGTVLEKYQDQSEQVIDPAIAAEIDDVLSDNAARAPAFGDHSYLYFDGRPVAVKTGTTNDTRDAWVIGYTPDIVLGSWAGNNDNTKMVKTVAGFIVAPMWNAVMQDILAQTPAEPFPGYTLPDPSTEKPILAGSWQSGGPHSILYWVDKADPLGPSPLSPAHDPQFPYWETAVQRWIGMGYTTVTVTPDVTEATSSIPAKNPLPNPTSQLNQQ